MLRKAALIICILLIILAIGLFIFGIGMLICSFLLAYNSKLVLYF